MNNNKLEKSYMSILNLLLIYFFIGFFFDFGSTIYAWFIITPPRLPNLGDLSMLVWLLGTCLIFLKILNVMAFDKVNLWIFLLFFFLIYGEGIHVVGNSLQMKLWHMGYKDALGLGLPIDPLLPQIPTNILPVFTFLYFCDEYMGHFFEFLSFLIFFIVFYYSGFSEEPVFVKIKHKMLFINVVFLNGLYIAWSAIEGQSVDLLLGTCLLMLGIKLYHRLKSNRRVNSIGKIFEFIFILAFLDLMLWKALIGHFNSIPQFFDTIAPLVGI